MKKVGFIFLIFLCTNLFASEPILPSKVNVWAQAKITKTSSGDSRTLFSGSGSILNKHQLNGITLFSGKSISFGSGGKSLERFFIIKEGIVQVSLNNSEYTLGKGSIVFLLPNEKVIFSNNSNGDAQFYEMISGSVSPNEDRGKKAGPSFVMDWKDMKFKAHDKGGVRQLFDRETVVMNRFDIHITTLNPKFNSHAPHTHKNEEIILMMDGIGDMFIATGPQRIISGDACYVESNILHNITNMGDRPATYFAIQWN